MTLECLRAAGSLAQHGVSAEVIDLRSVRPLPADLILNSVNKTGYVLSVDHAHTLCGVTGEISAMVTEHLFDRLQGPPQRLGLPDHPAPTSSVQSRHYYPLCHEIVSTCRRMMSMPDIPIRCRALAPRILLKSPSRSPTRLPRKNRSESRDIPIAERHTRHIAGRSEVLAICRASRF